MMAITYNKGIAQQFGLITPFLLAKGVIALLLVACLGSSFLQLSQLFSPPPKAVASTITEPERAIVNLPEIDISALTSIALFGEVVVAPPEPAVVEEVKEVVVVETKLNLSLSGLFVSDRKDLGRAIIVNGKRGELYQVGDEIDGLSNVKLTAVFSDRINLNNRGNAEVLYLYPENERITRQPSTSSPSVSSFVDNKPVNSVATKPDELKDGGNSKTKKLNEIMRVVRERDKETGDMLGFRVLPGRDRDAFNRSGLKVNDIIMSIDGEQLTDLRSAMAIYRNKREAVQVSLIIRRDTDEISLDLDLDNLNI